MSVKEMGLDISPDLRESLESREIRDKEIRKVIHIIARGGLEKRFV